MRFNPLPSAMLCALLLPFPRLDGVLFAQNATVVIEVDAVQAPRRLFHARLLIPASPGKLALLYPKWIPGEHGPTGPVTDLAGLEFRAAGKPIAWRRDAEEMYRI